MIKPHLIKRNMAGFWWRSAENGLYTFISDDCAEHSLIVVRNGELDLEIFAFNGMWASYINDGITLISIEQAIEYLLSKYPGYAEWLLFHPEFLQ